MTLKISFNRRINENLKSTQFEEVQHFYPFWLHLYAGTDEQLTEDGKPWTVFNGIPDWVFDEEVFEENNAIWWAPDGNKLAWGKFDDTNVDIYKLAK